MPAASRSAIVVMPSARSWRYTSKYGDASTGPRFEAALVKLTNRPSAEMDGCHPLAEEYVHQRVGVSRDEVRGSTLERHEPPVGRQRGKGALAGGLGSGGIEADDLRRATRPVAQEDVSHPVRPARHQIGCGARE